jgi:hypothetical protein
MASVRGLLNIQSLIELTYEKFTIVNVIYRHQRVRGHGACSLSLIQSLYLHEVVDCSSRLRCTVLYWTSNAPEI